jgi:hypothetical protein
MMEREHKRCMRPTGEVEWEIDESEWIPMISNPDGDKFLDLYGEGA